MAYPCSYYRICVVSGKTRMFRLFNILNILQRNLYLLIFVCACYHRCHHCHILHKPQMSPLCLGTLNQLEKSLCHILQHWCFWEGLILLCWQQSVSTWPQMTSTTEFSTHACRRLFLPVRSLVFGVTQKSAMPIAHIKPFTPNLCSVCWNMCYRKDMVWIWS